MSKIHWRCFRNDITKRSGMANNYQDETDKVNYEFVFLLVVLIVDYNLFICFTVEHKN